VLGLLARGKSNRQIADRLTVAPKTVANHIEHVYAKIGVSSRAAATLFAWQRGLAGCVRGRALRSGCCQLQPRDHNMLWCFNDTRVLPVVVWRVNFDNTRRRQPAPAGSPDAYIPPAEKKRHGSAWFPAKDSGRAPRRTPARSSAPAPNLVRDCDHAPTVETAGRGDRDAWPTIHHLNAERAVHVRGTGDDRRIRRMDWYFRHDSSPPGRSARYRTFPDGRFSGLWTGTNLMRTLTESIQRGDDGAQTDLASASY
jgi:hypothetical protein